MRHLNILRNKAYKGAFLAPPYSLIKPWGGLKMPTTLPPYYDDTLHFGVDLLTFKGFVEMLLENESKEGESNDA
jgi:hypothetical protein